MKWYKLHKEAKGLTATVPGKGFVVFNRKSVKPLPDDVVAKNRYVERHILVPVDEEEAHASVNQTLDGEREMSAAKAARLRARQRWALRAGVDRTAKSPTKARAERAKSRKAAAGTASPDAPAGGAPSPDAPPAA